VAEQLPDFTTVEGRAWLLSPAAREWLVAQKAIADAATPGEWSLPHFCSDEVGCDCGYVLCEQYMGAICTVHVKTEKNADGDDPPPEEAKANAALIVSARNNYSALLSALIEAGEQREWRAIWERSVSSPNKAPYWLADCEKGSSREEAEAWVEKLRKWPDRYRNVRIESRRPAGEWKTEEEKP
jgi:hypothetical protein